MRNYLFFGTRRQFENCDTLLVILILLFLHNTRVVRKSNDAQVDGWKTKLMHKTSIYLIQLRASIILFSAVSVE